MSMIKIIPPGSYTLGEEVARLVKYASSGLRGGDLTALIKRAGHEFADKVKNLDLKPGEVPVHLIALGATEAVGPNRNGDGFKCASCRRYHDTFVKHARWYRNHKNKDESKSYGIVKLSMYNEAMKRVELLVALNGTKEAAERNGGLVADQELQKLEKGDDIGVSMACKVAYDVCSGCGNRARTRQEYCTGTEEGGTCKYGGLQTNIGTVHESGHHLHADNPHPKFFDISMVFRPADRTAYVLGKAASSGLIVCGAALAEELGVSAPVTLLDESDYNADVLSQIKLAHALAQLEQSVLRSELDRAFDPVLSKSSVDGIDTMGHHQLPGALRALANEKIALSVHDWLKMVTGASEEKCAEAATAVALCLPNVFNELVEDPDLGNLIHSNPCKAAHSATTTQERWATKYAADHSLDRRHVQHRIWRSAVQGNNTPPVRTKSASEISDVTRQLARQYAVYQIGFLHDLKQQDDFDLTCELLVRQNRVS